SPGSPAPHSMSESKGTQHMTSSSRLAAGSTALLVVLVATACTPTDSPDSAGGETLSIGVSADIVELVPSAIQQFNTLSIVSNLYDQLVQEPEEGTVPVPRLATTWEVSDDRLTYSFDLREDALFHDGSTVDAEDVKWSI